MGLRYALQGPSRRSPFTESLGHGDKESTHRANPHSCIRLSSKDSTIPRSGNTVPQPPHDPPYKQRSKVRRKKRFRSPARPQPGTLSSTRASGAHQSKPRSARMGTPGNLYGLFNQLETAVVWEHERLYAISGVSVGCRSSYNSWIW